MREDSEELEPELLALLEYLQPRDDTIFVENLIWAMQVVAADRRAQRGEPPPPAALCYEYDEKTPTPAANDNRPSGEHPTGPRLVRAPARAARPGPPRPRAPLTR